MIEYDPNLPQEFSRSPKRKGYPGLFIAFVLVVVFLLSAFISQPRSKAPGNDNMAAVQQEAAPSPRPSSQ